MNVAKHWYRAGEVFAISDCLVIQGDVHMVDQVDVGIDPLHNWFKIQMCVFTRNSRGWLTDTCIGLWQQRLRLSVIRAGYFVSTNRCSWCYLSCQTYGHIIGERT